MIITAQGAGGFAGLSTRFSVDTAKATNGQAIENLVHDINFFDREVPEAVGADLVRWTISVDTGTQHRTITFADDGSAQFAPWQALLAQLRAA